MDALQPITILVMSGVRKEIIKMTGKEYVELAMRTNDGNATDRIEKAIELLHRPDKPKCFKPVVEDLGGVLNGCLGLAGEAGETLDMIKKWIFHEKDLDREHFKKELGDVMWYMAMICYSFGFDLDEILQMNIDKLKARYPEGFDTERANHRAEGDI